MGNVFIERLWRSLKHECVYLHAFEIGSELGDVLGIWIDFYNTRRPHSSLAGCAPDSATDLMGPEPSQYARKAPFRGLDLVA